MNTVIRLVALMVALTAQAGAAERVAQSHETQWGRYDKYSNFGGQVTHARDVIVFVPAGPKPAEGYAVIYMHDGRNVFDPATSTGHQPWAADRAVNEGHFPAIVVAIDNTTLRWSEYMPQSVFAALPSTVVAAAQGKEPPPQSDAYVDFIADELKPWIDAHYPTRQDPAHTFIMGSSMGGLISIYAMERRPEIFGRAAGLSTHWTATTNFALYGTGPESADAELTVIANTTVDTLADHLPDAVSHRLWVDYGDRTLDQFYPTYAKRFEQRATNLGWGNSLAVRAIPDAAHDETSWRQRLPEILEFLFSP